MAKLITSHHTHEKVGSSALHMMSPGELGEGEASQGRQFSRTQWLEEKIEYRMEKRQRTPQDTEEGEQVEGQLLCGTEHGSFQAWQSSIS